MSISACDRFRLVTSKLCYQLSTQPVVFVTKRRISEWRVSRYRTK